MIKPKNIQLSEKVEYLHVIGTFGSYIDSRGNIRHTFSTKRWGFVRTSEGNERLIDFVNKMIDGGLYPDLQAYLVSEDKSKFFSV